MACGKTEGLRLASLPGLGDCLGDGETLGLALRLGLMLGEGLSGPAGLRDRLRLLGGVTDLCLPLRSLLRLRYLLYSGDLLRRRGGGDRLSFLLPRDALSSSIDFPSGSRATYSTVIVCPAIDMGRLMTTGLNHDAK